MMAKQQTDAGIFLVLSSPSGAGKTSISHHLLREDDALFLSISATTRPRRPNEVNGVDYHFVSQEEFDKQKAQDAFLESALVFGNSYGTPKEPIEQALQAGKDILFDIDWQGAQRLAQHNKVRLVRIFILPPSAQALQQRLTTRAQDDVATRQKRMDEAENEIRHYDEYDYVVVNEDLAQSVALVRAILNAERAKRTRQPKLGGFVQG